MNKKFAIGIPTINRIDLLKPALLYYAIDFPNTKIFVMDNGMQRIGKDADIMRNEHFHLIESFENFGVAASWNILCEMIFENHDFALILNDDDYLGVDEGTMSAVVNLAETEEYKGKFYCAINNGRPDFDSFLLSKEVYEKVGAFDEKFFPAYYEDDDYIVRLHHAGVEVQHIQILQPKIVRNTSSLSGIVGGSELVEKNRLYFLEKWGNKDPQKAYKEPFKKNDDEN